MKVTRSFLEDRLADQVRRQLYVLFAGTALLVATAAVLGWFREPLQLRLDPPVAADLDRFRLMDMGIGGAPPESYFERGAPYETSAYNLSQGKRLYTWFGCRACHGDGQGGKGPSFLDGWWYYGPDMVSIVASIRDGRPHGMPAYRDQMTTEQIWQLAGYVQTIGSYTPKIAAPSRNDDEHTRPPENRGPARLMFDPGPTPFHPDQGPTP